MRNSYKTNSLQLITFPRAACERGHCRKENLVFLLSIIGLDFDVTFLRTCYLFDIMCLQMLLYIYIAFLLTFIYIAFVLTFEHLFAGMTAGQNKKKYAVFSVLK